MPSLTVMPVMKPELMHVPSLESFDSVQVEVSPASSPEGRIT